MKQNRILILTLLLFLTSAGIFTFAQSNDNRFISYTVDPKKQEIKLYWKEDKNQNFKSIENLKVWLDKHKRKLVFAMNGGMYKTGGSPTTHAD